MAKTKMLRDLVKGDVIRIEYGDYDNWVTVDVDHIELQSTGYHDCKVVGTYSKVVGTYAGLPFEAWGCSADDVDIVEKPVESGENEK